MRTKSFLFGMLAVAGMLFVSSCAQDDALEGAADSNYVDATFTVTTENAVGTRAGATNVGEGTTVNYVACAIFDEKTGEEIDGLRQYKAITNKAATYSVRLVKGQGYRAVFFAYCGQDNGVNAYYDLSDLKEVEVLAANSNLEERDAFTGYVDVKAEETLNSVTKPVKLTRPFAQLNLGSYAEDIAAAATAEVVVTESKVTVSNVYTVFSAYDNAVPQSAVAKEVTFAMNEIPAQTLSVDKDNDANTPDEQYEYLALNYLLVGNTGAEKNLTDVSFEWKTADGKTNSPATTFINIPVQRNYRTNIVGYLLTNPADFNVTIEKEFAKPDYNVIYAGGTAAAPEKMENVMADINDNGVKDAVVKVPAGAYVSWTTGGGGGSNPLVGAGNTTTETVTIQGDGASSVFVAEGAGVGSLRAANGAKLIFKDITIEDKSVSYDENAWEFTYLEFAGELEFNNVTFKSGILLEASEGVLNAKFNNCTFITNEPSVYGAWVSHGNATFSNCKFQGTRGLKMHEQYGSEIASVTVDACEFGPLAEKPGVAIGDLNAGTVVTIKNSSFIGCQPGDQNQYIYESDTNVNTFTFSLSNNSVVEDPSKLVLIATKADLIAFQNDVNVNGNGYAGKTIKLTADIDLEGMTWEPIGQTGGNGVATYFQGSFDGQDHVIKNFVITPNPTYGEGEHYAAGLFGFVDAGNAVIKNLIIDNATVTGHHWTAAIAGYLTGSIQKCKVMNSNITCTHANSEACGDKAGTIVGYINSGSVVDCSAVDCTVTAGRDAGQIVGCNSAGQVVSGCTATNVFVYATGDCPSEGNIKNDIIGRQN